MKNKKGKKLVVLGAMAALLTLIGVSGSQTYAKYVESTTVQGESATVAKWGYVASVNASNLFGNDYLYVVDEPNSKVADGVGLTVSANGDYDVVAPGTTGEMTISISGSSEVITQLRFEGANTIQDVYLKDASGKYYYPLQWTLAGSVKSNGAEVKDLDKTGHLNDCLQTLLNADYTFSANATISVEATLSWVWNFDNTSDTALLNTFTTDIDDDYFSGNACDTFLGILKYNPAADKSGLQYDYDDVKAAFTSCLDVSFSALTITLEQVKSA